MKAALELRNKLKAKKPHFLRQDAHKIKRLKDKWRQPRGLHSQMRVKRKGHRRHPSIGFSSPKEAYGLTRDGFKIVNVSNVNDLSKIKDKSFEVALISGSVGIKKKLEILKKAKEQNFKVINFKSAEEYIKKKEELFNARKEIIKQKEDKKKKIKEDNKKKVEEKAKEVSAEDKEAQDKEEKRKVLEKGQ